jgi:8-oxo-dGTP diphosphatase
VTCPSCGTTHYANPKPCGGGLVSDDDGRLLLVKRANDPFGGYWDIPGGFCELRETPREAAIREVREETGLEVDAGDLAGMWIDEDGYSGVVTLNCYFHARVTGGSECPQPSEVTEMAWFAPEELPVDRIAFPGHARVVLEAWRDGRA